MPTLTINGPVVPADANNEVLRDALLHSPIARDVNPSAYHLVEIGVREGAYTSWVGSWDQSSQKVDASTPTSILDVGRKGMRLRAGQAVVVRVSMTGAPVSLRGVCVTCRMALVGGRDGPAKPLVSAGSLADPSNRSAVAVLERQINTGGLAQWDEPIHLIDPDAIAGPVTRLPAVTPTQLTASVNDYDPDHLDSAAVLRLSSSASWNITGIVAQDDGREIVLFNVGSQNIVLKNASASSVVANRFSIGADFTITSGGSCAIWYDATSAVWRLI